MKKRKTPAKRIKDLSAKKASAKNVRGGALASYLKLKGQKQGQLKG